MAVFGGFIGIPGRLPESFKGVLKGLRVVQESQSRSRQSQWGFRGSQGSSWASKGVLGGFRLQEFPEGFRGVPRGFRVASGVHRELKCQNGSKVSRRRSREIREHFRES